MVSANTRTPVDDEASRLGQAVHRVLEWAARERTSALRLEALAKAASREFAVDQRQVTQVAMRILRSPACARFFGGDALRWAGNEVPVSEAGEALRVDRLVAIEESGQRTWWVLDYKLHHTPQTLIAYREQLLRYRAAVSALQPGEPVHAAFITGAGELIEVDCA
jgi:ATP-dependent helicase/nuclease subunit A